MSGCRRRDRDPKHSVSYQTALAAAFRKALPGSGAAGFLQGPRAVRSRCSLARRDRHDPKPDRDQRRSHMGLLVTCGRQFCHLITPPAGAGGRSTARVGILRNPMSAVIPHRRPSESLIGEFANTEECESGLSDCKQQPVVDCSQVFAGLATSKWSRIADTTARNISGVNRPVFVL